MSAGTYDAWLTTDRSFDGEQPLPGDPGYPRCSCGAFLRLEPDHTGYGEQCDPCDGQPQWWGGAECGRPGPHEPHEFLAHAWQVNHRICSACGYDNQEVD